MSWTRYTIVVWRSCIACMLSFDEFSKISYRIARASNNSLNGSRYIFHHCSAVSPKAKLPWLSATLQVRYNCWHLTIFFLCEQLIYCKILKNSLNESILCYRVVPKVKAKKVKGQKMVKTLGSGFKRLSQKSITTEKIVKREVGLKFRSHWS